MLNNTFLLMIMVFMLITICVILYAFYIAIKKRKAQNDSMIGDWQLQNQYMDHNIEFCDKAREITEFVHSTIENLDIKNSVECISRCSSLMNYIHGGSTAAEALLVDKKNRCADCGIEFRDNIKLLPEDTYIKEIDIVSLIGNLLDNAIDAAVSCGNTSPFVEINSNVSRNIWMIRVVNSKSDDIKLNYDNMKTTKKDQDSHGLGIGIIKSIVNSYNGQLHIRDNGTSAKISASLILNRRRRRRK